MTPGELLLSRDRFIVGQDWSLDGASRLFPLMTVTEARAARDDKV
jgi:hypothetical protein